MGTQDITRSEFDPGKQYTGARLQQGRVILDSDWNADKEIAAEDLRRSRVEIVGPAGSPDDGFRISNPRATGGKVDFDIGEGSFYLGGARLEMHQPQTYRLQRDLLLGPDQPAPTGARTDLVVLCTYPQTVTAVEDSELFEKALGGADSSTRTRGMQRVELWTNMGTNNCLHAFQVGLNARSAQGTLNAENELVPDSKLQVTYATTGTSGSLCSPAAAGGYLGAENQAIRVQLVSANTLTWGFDNAAPLYRVEIESNDRRTLTLLTDPKDREHWPQADQTVEILPWAALLPNGEKVAEVEGHLVQVQSCNPSKSEGQLTLKQPVPASYDGWKSRADANTLAQGGEYTYMRVWNRGPDTASPAAIPFTPGTPVPLGQTGLRVTLTGTQLRAGDYWIIAARPETPDQVVPWDLETGRRPHGVRRFYAPLALIEWGMQGGTVGGTVQDCRPHFPPLTGITAGDVSFDNQTCEIPAAETVQDALDALCGRGGGKCTLTATPGQGWESIFARIAPGQDAQVCFPVGDYPLGQAALVQGKGHLLVTGAGPGTKIVAQQAESALAFQGCASVTVRDLYAEAQITGAKGARRHLNGVLSFVDCPQVTVEDVTLRCAAGTRRSATCITVRIGESAAQHARARIRHNDLHIGHEQSGILLVNVARVHVEDNTLTVVKKPRSMTMKRMLRDTTVRAAARKALIGNVVAVDPSHLVAGALGPINLVLTETMEGTFATSAAGGTPAPGVEEALKRVGGSERNATMVWGGYAVGFRAGSSALASDLMALLQASTPAGGTPSTTVELVHHAEYVVDRALVHPETLTGTLRKWYSDLVSENPAVASQGIVVGGQSAEDVRILNNTIHGVRQGIHVGQSRRLADRHPSRIDRTERLQIVGNTITVLLPLLQFIERHGIFSGNCGSLRIENNYIVVKRYSGTLYLNFDGIRVFGIMGRHVLVRGNHIHDPIVGVYYNPINPDIESLGEPHPVWVIADNLSTGGRVREACEIGDRPQVDETAAGKAARERRNAIKRGLVTRIRNEP